MEPVRSVGRRIAKLTRPRLLPSLFDRHPHAGAAARRALGVRVVDLDQIVGTARHPSQNTIDFLPLPRLRGRNWAARWQRLNRAMADLATLPPIDVMQVGDEYWVVDGHNRVAAARRNGSIGIDADVVQLILPGVEASDAPHHTVAGSVSGGDQLRQAASGRRQSRTVLPRSASDELSREDLLRGEDALAFPGASETTRPPHDTEPDPE